MSPLEELRYLVLAVQREGNRRLAADLRPLGLTPSQAEVLRVLRERGPLALSALGGLLVCETTASPSRLVDRLVARGLVQRVTDPGDRRFVSLTLTPGGAAAERRIEAVEDRFYETLASLIAGRPLEQALELLRGVAAGTPAGQAVARRTGRDGLNGA
jgi:DNA-binding MarR family transcriptional regulator